MRMAARAGRPDLLVVDPALDRPGDPQRLVGNWSVDVETTDGQLVGRVSFLVAE